MRKSQRNPSKLSRFVHYKWSGPIVFAPVIILAVVGYFVITAPTEFFESWQCIEIEEYLLGNTPAQYPKHNELTESQHLRLHTIYQECVDNTDFLTPHT